MPPQAEISAERLQSELMKWPAIFAKNKLVGSNHPVWSEIKKSLKLQMSASSIHLHVYNNRHGCKNILEGHFKIDVEKDITRRLKKRPIDPDYVDNKIADVNSCESLTFKIKIPANQLIESLAVKKKTTTWISNLHTALVQSQGLPCAYDYRNGYITNERFKFSGVCSECKTPIRGESAIICNLQDELEIIVHTFATQGIKHAKKKKISGASRTIVKKLLLQKLPSDFRLELIGAAKTNYETADINSTAVYAKIRQEALNEDIGYNILKSVPMFNKTFIEHCNIRKLSLHPFNLFYWSNDQIKLWNEVQFLRLPLSIDATGSLVKRYSYESGQKSKPIFYYVMVIGLSRKIIPLLQGLLSTHNVAIIQELLHTWIESGAEIPKEISTDGSLALQIAINLVFNKMTFKHYNLVCYKMLRNHQEESLSLPSCYYRHDVAHLLHAVKRWKCFTTVESDVVTFYLRCIGYLTQVKTLCQFEDIVVSIIIIAQTLVVDSECCRRKTILNDIFKTFEYDFDKFARDCQELSTSTVAIKNPCNVDDELVSYIHELFEKALKLCCVIDEMTAQANYYYCADFIKLFKSLCCTFPSWTNIMKDLYGSPYDVGTSARSEAYFKKKKESIPNPVIVQKFALKDKKKIDCLTNFGFQHVEEGHEKDIDEDVNFHNIDLNVLKISDDFQKVYPSIFQDSERNVPISCNKIATESDGVLNTKRVISSSIKEASTLNSNNNQIPVDVETSVLDGHSSNDENYTEVIYADSSLDESSDVLDTKRVISSSIKEASTLNSSNNQIPVDVETTVLDGHSSNDESYTEVIYADSSLDESSDVYIHLNFGKWRNLIQNGGILSPRKFFNQIIKLVNTCPLDSLMELFIAAFSFRGSFEQFIFELGASGKSCHEIFKILEKYARSKSRKVYYESRLEYCKIHYSQTLTNKGNYFEIDCRDNVVSLFEAIMPENYCVEKIIKCVCNYTDRRKYNVQTVNMNYLMNDNLILKLKDYLLQYFSNQRKKCYKYNEEQASLTYKISFYFYVELETNFIYHKDMKSDLNSIPLNLHLCKEDYELVGVIAFDLMCTSGGLMHYYTFIKLADGSWEKRDNMKNVITVYNRNSTEKIKPALLFYKRKNVYKKNILTFF